MRTTKAFCRDLALGLVLRLTSDQLHSGKELYLSLINGFPVNLEETAEFTGQRGSIT